MMNYISREYLIESILNEDLALGAPTSPRKRSTFISDTNDRDSSAEGARASKGGQSKKAFVGNQLIFRKPTKAEIVAVADKFNRNLGGDAQIVQIRALSKVLFDFDLLDKVYKAKKDDWNYGKTNAAEIDKMVGNLRRIFHNYPGDTPVEEVAEDLENSTGRLEQEYGVRIPEIIGAIDNWRMILQLDPRTKSADFPKGFNPILMQNISAVSNGNINEIYKKVNELLIDASVKWKTPKAFAKYIAKNETMRAILDEPIVKKAFDEAMSTGMVHDVEELSLFLNKHLSTNRVERSEGHTMTIINDIASKRIRYFDLMMKRKGYEGGIRDFQEMIEFLSKYRPSTFEHICRTYHLDEESLKQFNSYNDFCDWLWGDPDRFNEILLSVPTDVGARTKGGIAKGLDMAVRRRDLLKKEERLRDKLDNPGAKRGKKARTIEELEAEIEKLQNIRKELKDDLVERKKNGQSKGDPEFDRVKKLEFDAGKQIAALSLTLRKRQAAGEQPVTKSLEDRISEYRSEREKLEDRVFDRLKDDAEIDEFNREFNRDKQREQMGDYDIASGYRTMSFSLKVSPNDTEAVDTIVNYLDKTLNKKELEAGKEDLINVDYEPSKYDGGMRRYPCIRIVIDYPEKSALFKRIKSTPKNERSAIVGEIIQGVFDKVYKELGANIGLVTKDPEHKIKIAAKNETSYSFRD